MKETQLDGESLDIVSDNVSKLKEIFPEVITEDKIDFDKLKLILGSDIDTDSERYSFTWPGKTQAIKESQKQSTGTLRPCKEESKNWDTTKNLYIEGDNLEVLKLLQKGYYNKIKCIYIDPPYNTGNDFIYKDNYHDNLLNYLEISGQTGNGQRFTTNTESSGRFHTNWLNMMYPRLKLARNLLKDDGIIFISIDDNELSNIKRLCDEIFGEENFISQIAWFKGYGKNESNFVSNNMEYILVYSKNILILKEDKSNKFLTVKEGFNEVMSIIEKGKLKNISKKDIEKEIKLFYKKNPNLKGITAYNKLDDNLELFRLVSMEKPKDPCYFYDIIHPITKKPCKIPKKGWRMPENTYYNWLEQNLIFFGKDESTIPNRKYLLKDMKYETPKNFIPNFDQGGNEILKLFAGEHIFDYPKPTSLISYLLEISNISNCYILDFFSGSATTAHSLFKLNLENNLKCKFILVQIPEETDENSPAFKAGYKNLCEIGKERIRRVGDRIVQESGRRDLDMGFKVFKLDSSNLNKWDSDYDNLEQTLLMAEDNIKDERTQEDLIYEIMLKYGIDLTLPIEKYDAGENKIYSIGFGALLICLDNKITKDITDSIIELASEDVSRVVFKDNGFASDADKTNIKETLRTHNIDEFITI